MLPFSCALICYTDALKRVFPIYGLPSILHSGNGRGFINQVIEEVIKYKCLNFQSFNCVITIFNTNPDSNIIFGCAMLFYTSASLFCLL